MKLELKLPKSTACAIGIVLSMLAGNTQAQQFPIPTTAAEVPGPAAGNTMTKAYVQMVGRMAYLWGWPLVNNANRARGLLQGARAWTGRRRRCRSPTTGSPC